MAIAGRRPHLLTMFYYPAADFPNRRLTPGKARGTSALRRDPGRAEHLASSDMFMEVDDGYVARPGSPLRTASTGRVCVSPWPKVPRLTASSRER